MLCLGNLSISRCLTCLIILTATWYFIAWLYHNLFNSVLWVYIHFISKLLLLKNPSAMQETRVRKIHWRRNRLPTPVFLGFSCGSAGKESACNVGDLGLIPGLGRSPGEGKGYPLQYSGLENSMDCVSIHGVEESDMAERPSLSLL